jgi:hypothetical protein
MIAVSVQFEGCRLSRTYNISATEFKISYGWVRRSTARHDLTIKLRITTARRLPEVYEEKLASFQKYVVKLRKRHEHLFGQTGNADLTTEFFDMSESTTINCTGKRTMQI